MQSISEYLTPFFKLVEAMAPYLLLGFFIAGLLHAFVPRRLYARFLAGRSVKSVVNAALMGVPLPLCSCGVIPTAVSLRKNGASKGAAVSFLISTPQTGVDSILATGAMMGWWMALIRPVTAFIGGLVGGVAVNRFGGPESEGTAAETTADEPTPAQAAGFIGGMRSALNYGFVTMIQDIGRWLVIGLVVAALITILVPDNFFDALQGNPLLNMGAVMLIAVPMYVCATGSIPIAVALMAKGLTPGAALVFLMAGPATNMAAIMVIGKVMGKRSLALYLTAIIATALTAGLLLDAFVPAELLGIPAACSGACHGAGAATPWWQTLSAVIFLALLGNAFIRKYLFKHNTEEMNTDNNNSLTLKVGGMMCNHCKAGVERAVMAVDGVESCDVNLESGIVTITGSASGDVVSNAITAIGYTVE